MTPASVPPLVMAGIAFYVAQYHLGLYLQRKRHREDLYFALTCAAGCVYDLLCVGLYSAGSVVEGAGWQRGQLVALSLACTALLWFADEFTRRGRRGVLHALSVLSLAAALVQAVDRSPLTWIVSRPAIKEAALPLGFAVTYHEAVPGPFTVIQILAILALYAYIAVMLGRSYRSRSRSRTGWLVLALVISYAAAINDGAITFGLYRSAYLIEYAFQALILIISFTLSAQIVAAAKAEERFRALVETTSDWVWEVDRDFVYTYCSPKIGTVLGYEPQELLGASRLQWMPPEERRRLEPLMRDLLRSGRPLQRLESRAIRRDGQTVWLETSAEPFLDGRGVPMGFRGIDRDVTDRIQNEAARRESEALLLQAHTVVINSPVVVFRWGARPGWPVEIVTENVARFGYAAQELLSGEVGYSTLVHPEDIERVAAEVQRHVDAGRRSFRQEYRLVARDGSVRWIDNRTVVERDAAGNPLYFEGVVVDVTESKLLERETEERRAYLERILATAPDAIITADTRHAILDWNPGAQRLFGYGRDEAIGRRIDDLITGGDARVGAEASEWTRTLERQCAVPLTETVRYRKDGTPVDVLASVAPIMAGAEWVGVVAIYTDISGQKRADREIRLLNASLEQRVQQRTAELRSVNKELESFAYSVSHDLRAPLRAMDGFSRALEEDCCGQLDDAGRQYIGHIRAAAATMGELIEGLLRLSRISRDPMRLEAVDLTSLAREVADSLSRGGASPVQVSIAPAMEAVCDRRLIRAAVENLMENAFKFTARRAEARVEIGSERLEGEQAFFVRDNGVGFDMSYAGKLFQPFQRLHRVDDYPGIGLGLANVQRVIHRHGGRCWAQGLPDGGATFWFTLPASLQERRAAGPPDS